MTFESWTILAYHLCTYTWILAYVAIIYRGFQDQSYGMPFIALTLNLGWEFVFAWMIPPYGTADSMLIPHGGLKAQGIFTIWFMLNLLILTTYFKFGYKEFQHRYDISRPQWIAFSVFMLVFSFFIMLTGGHFFASFSEYFNNDQIEGAKVIAFIQNALMSIAFVAMFHARNGDVRGQSFTIAWAKWIGTSMTGGIIYFLSRPDDFYFVDTFIVAIFIADVYYMVAIYRALKRQGINPWTRL